MKKTTLSIILSILIGVLLYWVSIYNYNLYHIMIEIAISMIGILIFSVSLNARTFNKVNLLVMLGPGFFVASLITMLHSFTYYGMNIIPGYDANLPTQLWIILSYILAFSFLITILLRENFPHYFGALISYSILGLIFIALSFLKIFPDCFTPEVGLTFFKKISEYIIILIYLVSILLLSRAKEIDKVYRKHITIIICLLIISGFFFTLYKDVYGINNFLGHYSRLWAFIIIYQSLLTDLIVSPYKKILFNSIHNDQTGFYNHNYFFDTLCKKDLINPTVFVLDIDSLKLVNDAFGFSKGDFLISIAGKIIRSCLLEDCTPSQISGGEFAIIMEKSNEDKINMFIQNLEKSIEEYNKDNTELPIYMTYGFSIREKRKVSTYQLYQEASESVKAKKVLNKKSTRYALIKTLVKTLEAKDFKTKEHASRMIELSTALAKEIGLPEHRINGLVLFTQFHDIGKIGIPDSILLKPGPLNEEERLIMQKHSILGYEIAISSSELAHISDFILKHHERWDGKGYPLGISGENIPIECRILSIVDTYDAIISDRPYRKGVSSEEAIEEIKRCAGTQFDPELVEKFLSVLSSSL